MGTNITWLLLFFRATPRVLSQTSADTSFRKYLGQIQLFMRGESTYPMFQDVKDPSQ